MHRSAVSVVLVVAVVLVFAVAQAAWATQDSWRVVLKADDGYGMYPASGAQLGVYPASVDGYDGQDGPVYSVLTGDFPGTAMHVATTVQGDPNAYFKNIQAPTAPPKYWDVFIAANVNSTASVIRPRMYSVSSTTFPPTHYNGMPVAYRLEMIDNRGVAGAPANGTSWELPIPTVHSTTVPFWTCPVNLPVIKLSAATNAALLSEGYKMQFQQLPVPEPSSMLALGSGLLGLAGLVARRKRW